MNSASLAGKLRMFIIIMARLFMQTIVGVKEDIVNQSWFFVTDLSYRRRIKKTASFIGKLATRWLFLGQASGVQ